MSHPDQDVTVQTQIYALWGAIDQLCTELSRRDAEALEHVQAASKRGEEQAERARMLYGEDVFRKMRSACEPGGDFFETTTADRLDAAKKRIAELEAELKSFASDFCEHMKHDEHGNRVCGKEKPGHGGIRSEESKPESRLSKFYALHAKDSIVYDGNDDPYQNDRADLFAWIVKHWDELSEIFSRPAELGEPGCLCLGDPLPGSAGGLFIPPIGDGPATGYDGMNAPESAKIAEERGEPCECMKKLVEMGAVSANFIKEKWCMQIVGSLKSPIIIVLKHCPICGRAL